MRFLLSRRWALFALVVVLLAYGAYWLGEWQFGRLADREAFNARTSANLRAATAAVDGVLAPGRPVRERDEWRRVSATGEYQPEDSVTVRYQTRDGTSGVDVVTPLRTTQGPLLLVDRGWVQTGNSGADRPDVPPPTGTVTIRGWVRADAEGDAATVTDASTRAISSREIAPTLDGQVYGGFVDLEKQAPTSAQTLVPAELPELNNGPHFFYGLQWWFFGVLAVFGFGYLAYDERRKLRARPAGDGPAPEGASGSEGPEHAAVDREHHTADEARSR